ncbi:hypothetical protein LCGC14_0416820 [marine sediment metagenome]|uniref:Portal protein n=1 Tax=marine sediment metagenome TaxID=412755 RepID=A0A0F9W1B0_9ZZZZ
MATDYLQKVKDKEEEFSALYTRHDSDRDLLYLTPYVMMDASGNNKVPDIVNVTLNIPGRFAHDVVAILGTAKEQIVVESEDKNLDTAYIEDFQRAGFSAANERLRLRNKWELNPWFDFHSSNRGGCAAKCLFQMVDGVLVADITPWDRRYVTYATGVKGLDWAGNKMIKTKDSIEGQTWAQEKGFTIDAKEAEVLEVLTTEHVEIWVAGKKEFEQEHDFGFCPVVIQTVTLGSMFSDKDSLAHQGEGIFFLIREAIPELERLLSIMQTLNLKTVKGPVQWESKEGQLKDPPEYEDVQASGAITSADIGGGAKRIDFGDAQRSAQLAYSIMREAIRDATVAASDLGVIESPPASGVRAMVAGESRDQLLGPRLGTKAFMNQGLANMFTAQVKLIGGSIELGTLAQKRTFDVGKLEGAYETHYKYTIKSAAVDAGRASLAAAYGNLIPDRAKRTEILQREDPDGDEKQLRWEEIERLVPEIKMRRDIKALIDMDEDAEARLVLAKLGVTLKQMLLGEVTPPKPEPKQEPKQVLSLFGGGGGRVQQPVVPEGEE